MPALDLGCNDGVFGKMLTSVLKQPVSLIGFDIDMQALNKAREMCGKPYSDLIQGCATRLPFADSSFSAVFSNAVLSSVEELRDAVREVNRVLASGGEFYCSVETNRFRESILVGRLLRRLGLESASEAYLRRLDRRFRGSNASLSATGWVDVFRDEGFSVYKVAGTYPSRLMPLWSLLAWTPMRIFGLLKFIPLKWVHNLSSGLQRKLFMKAYLGVEDDLGPEKGASILICMSK